MIDSLMDSLVLGKLPAHEWLEKTLAELCREAEDIEPILHSFKNDQQLCAGVRDILGKEDVQAITGTLSDIAQTCLGQIAGKEYERLAAHFGAPMAVSKEDETRPCEWVILGLGKFGGREMNYHSNLDVVFLYETDGRTAFDGEPSGRQSTSNQHFFSKLGQRIIKSVAQLSAHGRLYAIDARLRPTGKSGPLATTFREFIRYFHEGDGQLSGAAGPVQGAGGIGSPQAARLAEEAVAQVAFARDWQSGDAEEIGRHAAAVWRRPLRPATSSAGRAASSISNSPCRCSSFATGGNSRNFAACPTPWRP